MFTFQHETRVSVLLFFVLASVRLTALQGSIAEVPAATATVNIQKKIEPEYPALAKAARLQGTAVLKATISQDGSVSSVLVVSGPPMLIAAAVNAVKQWRYKPFIIDGQPTTVTTLIEVPFSLGVSEADYKEETRVADAYFSQEKKCRELVNKASYADAETACKPLIALAEKLPTERQMERITAYQYTGHALFGEKRFSDALTFYQHELAIAQTALNPTDAELAYAYRDVARGLHGTGDLSHARSSYEQAESTLKRAQEHIGSAFLQNEYAKTMKSILRDHAFLLRQMGDESGAETVDKRAESISIKPNVKDN
jgi:TonB family protein